MIAEQPYPTSVEGSWELANRQYLEGQLRRVRLLLQRRVRWLRACWKDDPLRPYQGLMISEEHADELLAGDDRQAEQRFSAADPASMHLGRAVRELEAELAGERARVRADCGRLPALETLVETFALTPFERDVLVLCLAPELDAAFERLYAYVQDDITRKYATAQLALSLFGAEGTERLTAAGSLLPNGPLRRWRLVTSDFAELGPGATTRGSLPLRLDVRICNFVLGIDGLDERLVGGLHLVDDTPTPLTRRHAELVDRLVEVLDANPVWIGQLPIINLVGPPRSGRSAVAAALARRLGLRLAMLDLTALMTLGPQLREALALLEREAVLGRFVCYVELLSSEREADAASAGLGVASLASQIGTLVVLASQDPWRPTTGVRREVRSVRVPKPDPAEQRDLWTELLAPVRHDVDGQLDSVVQQFDLGPGGIARTVAAAQYAHQLAAPASPLQLSADSLWQVCRDQASLRLDDLAQRVRPVHTWDDIVLPADVARQLREIAAQVANRPRVYEAWGFGARLNRGRGISALFAGPSGTGKTMAAEILAGHLGLELFRVDLAGVVSKYIGETEKNLRRVFDAAEGSGAILFFDEADALFGKRSEVKDSHDRYANIEVNYLLQRMEDYRGLAVLATNRKSHLDQAFLRRVRFLVDFPFPDAELRQHIWQRVFPVQAPRDGVDPIFLSRLELAGGNIKNIAVNAAFLAASADQPIRMPHVLRAARREYAKIDKLPLELEIGAFTSSGEENA